MTEKLHASFLGNFNIVFQISSPFDDFSEKRQNWGKNDYFTSNKNLLGNSTCAGRLEFCYEIFMQTFRKFQHRVFRYIQISTILVNPQNWGKNGYFISIKNVFGYSTGIGGLQTKWESIMQTFR